MSGSLSGNLISDYKPTQTIDSLSLNHLKKKRYSNLNDEFLDKVNQFGESRIGCVQTMLEYCISESVTLDQLLEKSKKQINFEKNENIGREKNTINMDQLGDFKTNGATIRHGL